MTDSIIVRKAPLTATCDDKERIDLMPNPTLTMTYSGCVHGEDKSVLDTKPWCDTAATKTSPAGDHAITCENGSDDNYKITCVDGTLTIEYVAPITYQGAQTFSEDTTIRRDDLVRGDVTVRDGTFKVEDTVIGDIDESGPGDVIVSGALGVGEVKGDITEFGVGGVNVYDGATVTGDIIEQGAGAVQVTGGSTVKGDISEAYGGGVLVGGSGTSVTGNVSESGDGDVVVRNDALVKGDVCEQDAGTVTVESGGVVKGSTTC